MRPQTAVARRVWVAFLVGVLVMDAMRRNPKYWPAFKSQRSAHCENVFHPLRSLIAAMRKQTVVAHADAEASGDPPENQRRQQRFPTEHEECSYRANM